MIRALLATIVLAACTAGHELPHARFANAPPALVVDDRRDVARPPSYRLYLPDLYTFEGTFVRPVDRALDLQRTRRARGVNALDEVPDSTWFTNRIAVRSLTPDEVRMGPITHDPSRHLPWLVLSTKVGGTEVGFVIKDAAGVKYQIKFDDASDPPELQTGVDAVVDRFLWAAGYNVAEDLVVYIRPSDLVLAPNAVVKDLTGKTARALDRAELAHDLTLIHHERDGRIRTLASRWIAGVTLGGHPGEGVRRDDPNDLIPHELRRDLRGQFPIYAWLDAVDVTEGQYVDSWVADPSVPGRRYVEHYAVDFGKSLGAQGAIGLDWWRGAAYLIDFAQMTRQLVTLGLTSRPWQDRRAPALRGVSPLFEVKAFDPGSWHPDAPGYLPFHTADRFDKFWGTKIVARFTRAQIRAAVEAGRFSDPRAVDYLTAMLVARQHATAAYWFARVNPLDQFAVAAARTGARLCFDDLAIANDAGATAATTRYAVTTYDRAGHRFGAHGELAAAPGGRSCAAVALAPGGDGYTIVELATARPGFRGTTFIYIARDPTTGAPRAIGVWRT